VTAGEEDRARIAKPRPASISKRASHVNNDASAPQVRAPQHNSKDARDWAVSDYRSHLQTVLKRKPATVNNALAAVDDLYIRRGLGPANAARAELPKTAPKALSPRAAVRFLREVQTCPHRAIARAP
jgi:hypothetical protein